MLGVRLKGSITKIPRNKVFPGSIFDADKARMSLEKTTPDLFQYYNDYLNKCPNSLSRLILTPLSR